MLQCENTPRITFYFLDKMHVHHEHYSHSIHVNHSLRIGRLRYRRNRTGYVFKTLTHLSIPSVVSEGHAYVRGGCQGQETTPRCDVRGDCPVQVPHLSARDVVSKGTATRKSGDYVKYVLLLKVNFSISLFYFYICRCVFLFTGGLRGRVVNASHFEANHPSPLWFGFESYER